MSGPGGEEFPAGEAGGVAFLQAATLVAATGLRHWFTGRRGGGSVGPHAALNLGLASGDDRATVEGNRTRCWAALGLPHAPLIPRQVHGAAVALVDGANRAAFLADPPEADAVVTALRGLPLAILTADCPAIIVWDTRTPALAVVHAGWRGTAASVLWRTLLTMMESFGTRPEDCRAALGPAIAGPCYEVGEDVRTAFVRGLAYGQDVLAPGGGPLKWLADLREANRRQLLDARLAPASVGICPACTHCEAAWFYSARRDRPVTGRQAAVAMLS